MRDVTDQRRAQQHVAAEQGVMRALTQLESLEDAGPVLLDILGAELGWDGAELWRMGDDERLRRHASWTAPDAGLERFMRAGDWLAHEVGDGLPGMAWMSRVPVWKADITDAAGLVRREEALADGLRSTVALPLRANGVPVGVIVLVSRTPREIEGGLTRLLEAIGGQVTQFLQRREAEARVAAQAADLRTLSNVAHELAAENDLFAARNTLCRAVRDVTSSVSVVLLEPSGRGAGRLRRRRRGRAADVRGARRAIRHRRGVPDGRADPRVRRDRRRARFELPGGGRRAVRGLGAGHPRRASVGVLAVGWTEHRPALTERDAELLRLLAAEAAITIHRTDLLARLQSTARTDPLTGLPNRRVWDEDLARELERARRHGGALCLAMLDLDRFKTYNDTHGHQAGDELLAAAATAWRPELRATDTLARYGGEEFAVLLPHSDAEGAQIVVERLLAVVPFDQTASAGIAVWDGDRERGRAARAGGRGLVRGQARGPGPRAIRRCRRVAPARSRRGRALITSAPPRSGSGGADDGVDRHRAAGLGHRHAVVAVHDGVAALGGDDADRRDHLAALLGHPQALPAGAGALAGGAEVGVELGGAVRLDRRVDRLDRDLADGVEVRRGAVARVVHRQLHALDAAAAQAGDEGGAARGARGTVERALRVHVGVSGGEHLVGGGGRG